MKFTKSQLKQKIEVLKSNVKNHPLKHVKSVVDQHNDLISNLENELIKLENS